MPILARINPRSGDRSLDAVATAQNDLRRQLSAIPFLDGQLMQGIAVGTSATIIQHGLRRLPRGWIVTDNTTGASLQRTAWDTQSITLIGSAGFSGDVWVF